MDSSQEQDTQPWIHLCFICVQNFVKKWPKLFNKWVFRLLTIIYFVLTIFITGTPFWTAELIQKSFTYMGLWSICHPKSCSRLKISDDTLNLMRIFTLIALLCGFLAVLGSWNVFFRITGKKTVEDGICAVLFFIAGISLKATAGIVYFHSEEHLFLNFYLAILLSILAILLGIISVLKILYWIFTKGRPSMPENILDGTRV